MHGPSLHGRGPIDTLDARRGDPVRRPQDSAGPARRRRLGIACRLRGRRAATRGRRRAASQSASSCVGARRLATEARDSQRRVNLAAAAGLRGEVPPMQLANVTIRVSLGLYPSQSRPLSESVSGRDPRFAVGGVPHPPAQNATPAPLCRSA